MKKLNKKEMVIGNNIMDRFEWLYSTSPEIFKEYSCMGKLGRYIEWLNRQWEMGLINREELIIAIQLDPQF